MIHEFVKDHPQLPGLWIQIAFNKEDARAIYKKGVVQNTNNRAFAYMNDEVTDWMNANFGKYGVGEDWFAVIAKSPLEWALGLMVVFQISFRCPNDDAEEGLKKAALFRMMFL